MHFLFEKKFLVMNWLINLYEIEQLMACGIKNGVKKRHGRINSRGNIF